MSAFKTVAGFSLICFTHEGSEPVARLEISEEIVTANDLSEKVVSFTCDGLGLLLSGMETGEAKEYLGAIRIALDRLGAVFEAYQRMLDSLSAGEITVPRILENYDMGTICEDVLQSMKPFLA